MYQKYLKRTFDTTISLIVLMLALPIGIVVALLIKIDSKGPSIFKQKRTGLHGSVFNMYKFRTMTCDNNVHDIKQANKLTTLGKIIRALSLDEIPQFVNVIKGEMSFIGPRPWVPEYYQHMTNTQRKRNSVRPGITGLAQARGRNELSVFDKINYDLLYIKKITFTNDIKIVVLTVLELFKRTGEAIDKLGIHHEIKTLKLQHSNQQTTDSDSFYSKLPTNNMQVDRVKRNKEGALDKLELTERKYKQSKKNNKVTTDYAVLMSVYAKEKPNYLLQSISSMLNQTVAPKEILVLKDGPLTKELDNTLENLKAKNKNINVISFPNNRGLGPTLADGIKISKTELIARMDSDDIADPKRCELQLKEFIADSELEIVGTNVTEFIDDINNVIAQRVMPESNSDILKFSKKRNPLAHPSVMFKKASVLKAGNYRDFKQCEDYDLWIRMIKNGAKCYNIQQNLVHMRISQDFYTRRGGLQYIKHIIRFKKELLDTGHYSLKDFTISATSSAVVGLMPNKLRSLLYARLLREKSVKHITSYE